MKYSSSKNIMRYWPFYFCVAWISWAIAAPEPWLNHNEHIAHVTAILGIIGLIWVGCCPGNKWARVIGTLMAITYPLHRAIALMLDDSLDPNRKAVAVGFSLVVCLSLLLLYPSLWWVSKRNEFFDDSPNG